MSFHHPRLQWLLLVICIGIGMQMLMPTHAVHATQPAVKQYVSLTFDAETVEFDGGRRSRLLVTVTNEGTEAARHVQVSVARSAAYEAVYGQIGQLKPGRSHQFVLQLDTHDPSAENAALTISVSAENSSDIVQSTLQKTAGKAPTFGASNDIKADWEPTFNQPVVSLFTGAATYNFPFELPPAPGTLQPALALTYNSSQANGLRWWIQSDPAGFGWSLTGTIDVIQSLGTCNNGFAACENTELDYNKYTLILNGAGHELTHASGRANNGATGRYFAEGDASVLVYYCENTALQICTAVEDDANPTNGRADAGGQRSKGYWVVKSADNTTYRLGYEAHSEQQVRAATDPTTLADHAYAGLLDNEALKWRVDKASDRFGNAILYTYSELYEPDTCCDDSGWRPINYIHTPASYLAAVEYSFANSTPAAGNGDYRIELTYSDTGDHYGSRSFIRAMSWEKRFLNNVYIKDNAGSTLRRYQLHHHWVANNGGYPYPYTLVLNGIDHHAGGATLIPGVRDYKFAYTMQQTGRFNGPFRISSSYN